MSQNAAHHVATRTVDLNLGIVSFNAPYLVPSESVFMHKRALGSGEDGSTSTTTSNGVVITETLFPTGDNRAPSPDGKHGISQTLLEWVFAVIALVLLTILVIWKCTWMKYRRRGSILPFSRGQAPRLSSSTPRPHSLRHPELAHARDLDPFNTPFDRQTRALQLSPAFLQTGIVPLVDQQGVQINDSGAGEGRARGGRRVRALDVDEGGRRRGGQDGHDDELPAYDIGKRPPGYQTVTADSDVIQVGLPECTTTSAHDEGVHHGGLDAPEYVETLADSQPHHETARSSPG